MEAIVKGSGVGLLRSLDGVERAAKLMVASGFFEDTRELAQAAVKIMAGAELGIGPYAAMTGINIIKGKPVLGASLMASLVRRGGVYDYAVDELSDTRCVITFFRQGRKLGVSEFTQVDAQRSGAGRADTTRSGQTNLQKFPKNILFARAMSNGVRWYCPDIFIGANPETDDVVDDYGTMEDGRPATAGEIASSGNQPISRDEVREERPYSAEEFSARYKVLVEKLNAKGAQVTQEQRSVVQDLLVRVFEDELEERAVLLFMTGVDEVELISGAQVIAFERIFRDFEMARVELLAVRDSINSLDGDGTDITGEAGDDL